LEILSFEGGELEGLFHVWFSTKGRKQDGQESGSLRWKR